MDPDPPKSLSTPNMALRSKPQVLMEEWGTLDVPHILTIMDEWSFAHGPVGETWTTLKLPYQAPSCPPLPSWEQIRDASKTHGLHARNGLHPVCKIGNTVIKYSGNPNIVEEAENILFLAEKRPQLRIPNVLAVWTVLVEGDAVVYCLMMDFVDGIALDGDDRLAELPVQAQDIIFAKVSAQIQYLRSLPSEGYYGRVHRQGWVDPPPGIRIDTGPLRSVSGPYNTYEEFLLAVHRAHELKMAIGTTGNEFPPRYASATTELLSIFSGWDPHEPKFTWIDPKLRNLIVRPIKGDAGIEDWEVFLIDWECAGWYPAWVQSLQFERRCGAITRDRSQAPYPCGNYPCLPYRRGEIIPQMLKNFDPNPDRERLAKVREVDWWLF